MLKNDIKSTPLPIQHMCQWFCKPSSIILSFVALSFYILFIVWTYDHITKRSEVTTQTSQTIMQTTNTENVPVNDDISTISGTTSGTATPRKKEIKQYACDPSGICNSYKNPKGQSQCPTVFNDINCSNKCGDVINRCKE